MTNKQLLLHTTAGLHPKDGGPTRTVIQLVNHISKFDNFAVNLYTHNFNNNLVSPASDEVVLNVVETSSLIAYKSGLAFRSELSDFIIKERPSVIHNHGLWLPVNHWVSRYANLYNIPHICQPHGMLEPWALNHHALKKSIALGLFQRRNLEMATLFVATAAMEYESIRALGLRQPVAVIPNGVILDTSPCNGATLVTSGMTERTVLFLSRVHQKKGILNLLHAWAALMPQGWRLKIAGPDEGGHLSEVKALARVLGIEQMVDYLGEVDGAAKTQTYFDADLFVLPTFSENFGVVVAEALAHGVPVITTRGAPWEELERYGCGWWIDIGVEPLVRALREAMALTDDQRGAMGKRGREYVRRYDWNDIAKEMIDVYRWVLGQGPQPDCVRTD